MNIDFSVLSIVLLLLISRAMSLYDVQRALNNDVTLTLRSRLISWYRANRRSMPWRGDGTVVPITPYSVWVSEVMLQQTRVETVVTYWNRWMETFPTVSDLAKASPDEVNQLWAGLGYYRRAQNLLKGAQFVVEKYDGKIPMNREGLLSIPGVGPYTAGAIASIAFQQREALVDGNVLRVFSRLFALSEEIGGGKMEKISWKIAEELVDVDMPGDFNQALMELGATICTPTNPKCHECPVNKLCAALRLVERSKSSNLSSKKQEEDVQLPAVSTYDIENLPIPQTVTTFPYKKEKKKARALSYLVVVLRQKCVSEWKYLMVRRPDKGLLANQWEFPSLCIFEEAKSVKGMKASTLKSGILNKNTKRQDTGGLEVLIDETEVVGSDVEEDDDFDEVVENYETEESRAHAQFISLWSQGKLTVDAIKHHSFWRAMSEQVETRTGVALTSASQQPKYASSTLFESLDSRRVSEPIVHIFSHERHTMYVIVEDVKSPAIPDRVKFEESMQNNSGESDSVWRTESEIVAAGITTGAKKVLAASKQLDANAQVTSKRKSGSKSVPSTSIKDVFFCESKKAVVKNEAEPVTTVSANDNNDIISDLVGKKRPAQQAPVSSTTTTTKDKRAKKTEQLSQEYAAHAKGMERFLYNPLVKSKNLNHGAVEAAESKEETMTAMDVVDLVD